MYGAKFLTESRRCYLIQWAQRHTLPLVTQKQFECTVQYRRQRRYEYAQKITQQKTFRRTPQQRTNDLCCVPDQTARTPHIVKQHEEAHAEHHDSDLLNLLVLNLGSNLRESNHHAKGKRRTAAGHGRAAVNETRTVVTCMTDALQTVRPTGGRANGSTRVIFCDEIKIVV